MQGVDSLEKTLMLGGIGGQEGKGTAEDDPGDLPNPGIELTSCTSPALAGRFFTTRTT